MAAVFVYMCVVFGLVSSQFSLMGIFEGPCPMGCLQSVCLYRSGCATGSCQAGWCKYYGGTGVGTICTPRCSEGQSCSSWGYCTRDRN
ncbi:hypothetical protein DPMN_091824 [Dreissena polymorpha]|uniref:Uncharacterized protein n=1 Tax=Dreissena polymorpha TaxID=45954 RepID=A0A9D4L180_DREPO|nr:hypothetical protein DPMN_091824 [Dreissena polymorpha]